jgi:hypothetical protein
VGEPSRAHLCRFSGCGGAAAVGECYAPLRHRARALPVVETLGARDREAGEGGEKNEIIGRERD